MPPKRIAVVGGGISGLTAAFSLAEARRAGVAVEEYLFEASPRLGGALRTERVDACIVEAGADSFLTEKPEARDLCRQLGLGDELIGSKDHQRRTLILHHGKLVPLPEGFEFLVPSRFMAMARTPLLSLRDKIALASEVVRRRSPSTEDESVAAFIERHFSRGLLENIVDPLLTAVYGGDPNLLSVQSLMPRFVEIEQRWGSLVRGLRQVSRERKANSTTKGREKNLRPPLFTTLRNGVETLVAALRARLPAERVICGRRVVDLVKADSATRPGSYRLHLEGNQTFEADGIILALPAYESGRLLRQWDPILSNRLMEIPYSSSMIVALGYDRQNLNNLPVSFGFLVPRIEKPRLLACTFVSYKFPHRATANQILLRCFLGGMRDEQVLDLDDAHTTATVRRDLKDILGITANPRFVRIYRWRKALAQYTVGHQERLRVIRSREAQHHGLVLCGNAYEGIGVPDCIRSGHTAAEKCLRQLQEV